MSWFQKILPPKIKRRVEARKSMPEGLWSKCPACNEVLYRADLESNLEVCPKCGHHHRIGARQRLAMLLDAEGQHEIGAQVTPLDPLKFKDSKKYPDRLKEAQAGTSETDALVVLGGSVKAVPVVAA
ncbi:MAG: acetyl-CoA carboxylase carboxyl transferase subunit beta, partial [Thiobacillus sp.]|nr:acetyl-CoA carboxylase carboxyl transferase subunit beta [Thiobacillus sp.]